MSLEEFRAFVAQWLSERRQKEQIGQKFCYRITTDARCSKRKIGDLCDEYLSDRLPPDQAIIFEKHILECMPCAAMTISYWSLKLAIQTEANQCTNWEVGRNRVTKYELDKLSPEEKVQFEQHLFQCATCARRLRGWRDLKITRHKKKSREPKR